MDDRIIDRMLGQLVDLGLEVRLQFSDDEGTVTLSRGRSTATFALADVDDVRNRLVHSDTAAPTLAVTDHVNSRTAELFRRIGIAYADGDGNTSLRFGDVLIDVRGRPRTRQAPLQHDRDQQPRARNLFTVGRSQVTCALLAWPMLWHAPTRDLAHAAGVSIGTAHESRRALGELGYDDFATVGNHRLLDLWAAAFPSGLARSLRIGEVSGDLDRPIDGAGHDIYIGGETAVRDVLHPATLTVYVADLTPQLMVANRWNTSGPANVLVRRTFWQAPEPHRHAEQIAPWPLVYADLFTSPDPRVRDTAEKWRRSFV